MRDAGRYRERVGRVMRFSADTGKASRPRGRSRSKTVRGPVRVSIEQARHARFSCSGFKLIDFLRGARRSGMLVAQRRLRRNATDKPPECHLPPFPIRTRLPSRGPRRARPVAFEKQCRFLLPKILDGRAVSRDMVAPKRCGRRSRRRRRDLAQDVRPPRGARSRPIGPDPA